MEHNKIDRNELLIHTNSQKATGIKIAAKLNNFEKFERKKSQISALFLTQRPPDDWPDALMSVLKISLPSAVVYFYCAWYNYFWNGR